MMNDQQIIAFISTSGGSLCGRFEPSQLNREYKILDPIKRRPYLPWAVIASALALVLPTSKVRSAPMMEQVAGEKIDTVILSSRGDDKVRYIKGMVRDSIACQPIPGCTIRIKNTSGGAIANESGQFKLKVPKEFEEQVTLQITFVGFDMKEIIVPLSTDTIRIEVDLIQRISGNSGIVIVEWSPSKKDTLTNTKSVIPGIVPFENHKKRKFLWIFRR